MRKHEKGITLIQTVIAVVMIAIIASFAIFNSRDTVVETKVAKIYNEIMTVKNAVTEFELLDEEGMEIFSGDRIQNLDDYQGLADKSKLNQEYYYLDFKNNKANLEEILEIKNVENNYIVNVKDIENIEIFSVDGVKIENKKYYTDAEIIAKYNDIFAGRQK